MFLFPAIPPAVHSAIRGSTTSVALHKGPYFRGFRNVKRGVGGYEPTGNQLLKEPSRIPGGAANTRPRIHHHSC